MPPCIFSLKSDAETYAKSLSEHLSKSSNMIISRFVVVPYKYDKRGNNPVSWGVVRRWRYAGRPDLGERADWVRVR